MVTVASVTAEAEGELLMEEMIWLTSVFEQQEDFQLIDDEMGRCYCQIHPLTVRLDRPPGF